MYQGQELLEQITKVYCIIVNYEANFLERTALEYQVRSQIAEKAKISISGAKGKARLTAIVTGIYVLVMLLFATIVYELVGAWIVVAICAAIAFVNWDKKKGLSVIAGGIAGLLIAYLFYVCVIDTVIRAFAAGNVPGIIIPIVMAAILAVIIIVINHKSVDISNAKIRKINAEILASNTSIKAQSDTLLVEAKELDASLLKELTPNGWYPAKYAYEDAANFFIDYLENVKPQATMSELIDKYEQERRDRENRAFQNRVENGIDHIIRNQEQMMQQFNQMIDNQEQTNQLLRFSNMIGMYNCYQMSVLNNNIDAMRHTRTTIYLK